MTSMTERSDQVDINSSIETYVPDEAMTERPKREQPSGHFIATALCMMALTGFVLTWAYFKICKLTPTLFYQTLHELATNKSVCIGGQTPCPLTALTFVAVGESLFYIGIFALFRLLIRNQNIQVDFTL